MAEQIYRIVITSKTDRSASDIRVRQIK